MKMRTLILAALLSGFVTGARAQTSDEVMARERALNSGAAKSSFIDALQGHRVALKEPLYSFIDSDPSNPNLRFSPGKPTYMAYGLTVLSPDKGTFYRHVYGPARNTDRDPQALLAKTGRDRFMRLAAYKAGTVFLVRANRGVLFSEDGVTIILIDELDNGGPLGVTTAVSVQWPQPFSGDFDEREAVMKLLDGYLEVR